MERDETTQPARFLIDVDGVLCDFVSGYCELVHQITGRAYTLADVTDFGFKSLGLTDYQRNRIVARLCEPGWVLTLGELPGAIDGVRAIEAAGNSVVFVTSPWRGHSTWAYERDHWLSQRFPNCRIISTNQKHCIDGDVLIDDKPEHIEQWSAAHPDGVGLLWDAPYNRASFFGRRVSDWSFILEFVREYRKAHGPSVGVLLREGTG